MILLRSLIHENSKQPSLLVSGLRCEIQRGSIGLISWKIIDLYFHRQRLSPVRWRSGLEHKTFCVDKLSVPAELTCDVIVRDPLPYLNRDRCCGNTSHGEVWRTWKIFIQGVDVQVVTQRS